MNYLNDLMTEIRRVNAANGFASPEDFSSDEAIPAKLALIHSEVSEALEAFRKDDKENFREEMADILIRVLDLCASLGVDIQLELQKKLDQNRRRPYKHDGKRI